LNKMMTTLSLILKTVHVNTLLYIIERDVGDGIYSQ
jgi:hypothetical protein